MEFNQAMYFAILAICAFSLQGCGVTSTSTDYVNVNGGTLQKCSGNGMALTGFTRNGQCIDQDDDAGSHHICIDMASNTGGNFCEVTGQPNWCSSTMACDGGSMFSSCPVKNWCVCQWAFAAYIERAGGCDKIQRVVCESTNMAALKAYREQAQQDTSIGNALKCLEQKCNIATELFT